MEAQMFFYSMSALLTNAVYAVITVLFVGGAFKLADKYLIKDIDTMKELHKGNVAVAIVAAAAMLTAGLVLGMVMR